MNKTSDKTVFKRKLEDQKKQDINPKVVKIVLFSLITILLAVIFVLPNFFENRNSLDKSNIEELALTQDDSVLKMRPLAKTAEYELSDKIQYLISKGIDFWGAEYISEITNLRDQGETAFLIEQYDIALASYRKALDLTVPLEISIPNRLIDTISQGQSSLLMGKREDALNFFEIALLIEPNSTIASTGFDRALKLDEVIALTSLGQQYFNNEKFEESIITFKEALIIDSQWQDAIDGLALSIEMFDEQQFNHFLSSGYKFMRENNFNESRKAFEKATKISPLSFEITQAMDELNNSERIYKIKTLRYEGLIQETKENWTDAKAKYSEILQLDPNIDSVRINIDRVNKRINLKNEMEFFINNSDKLNDEEKFSQATLSLKKAENIKIIGPKLEEQINKLKQILIIAAKPLDVVFISDTQTNVTIYKVGNLGAFDKKVLELKPGKYTGIGSRRGFRDVRLEFLVSPEQSEQIIRIACKDPI